MLLLLGGSACKRTPPEAPAQSPTPTPLRAPAANAFESIAGCALAPDKATNDGDSFRVRFPNGRLDVVRLYFVDAPESKTAYRDRLAEQAAYFGITRQQAVRVGDEAAEFTAKALEQPFTIHTRWKSLFGKRWLVMITTASGDDLGELLVRNGFARIYGVKTPLPDGRDSRVYLARLTELEQQAKGAGLGGWKHPAAVTTAD